MTAVNARNAIMSRQLLVEKRLVGRQQIDDAAVLLELSIEEQLHLPGKGDAQVVVEPGELLVQIRRQQPDVAGLQPLLEEVLHERRARTRVGEQAPPLSIEYGRLVQRPADGGIEQRIVGDAAPQEEREA